MLNTGEKHLVLHPALRLRRQHNLLLVEGSERQVKLEWILKAHHSSALWGGGGGIQLHILADINIAAQGARHLRTRATRRRRARAAGLRATSWRIERELDLG